jgi:hypothetical protein
MPFFLSHPAAAWLLPAVALPILFHLFFRLRRQVREFPSLMFFLRIDPRLSAKRKIHEWLILLLRCLFIALLIFALMRPLLGLKGAGGSVARLVLIDNSGSMAGATSGGKSKLTLVQRATERLVSLLRPGDSVAVQLMVPDPLATLPIGFDATPGVLRDAIAKLTPSDGAAPVPKALRRALATLGTAKASRRELIIVTDLQHDNWSRGDFTPEAQIVSMHVVLRRIASTPPSAGSVSLSPLELPNRAIPAGRIVPLRLALQNNGPAPAHVRLNSMDDSGKNQSSEVEVATTTAAVQTFSFGTPGFHWAESWVEGDLAPAATRVAFGFWCTEVRKVFFVGAKDDFAALPYAVSPGGNADLSGINGVTISTDQLTGALAAKPLAVVLTWSDWPQDTATSQALETYVRQGGTLLLVPRPDSKIASTVPAWLDASLGLAHTATQPEPMLLLRNGDALWHDLNDASGRPQLGTLRAFQYRSLKTGADWQTLIASAQGAPLLARRNLDQGRILASGLAFTPQWSSLPLKAGFVVLVQNAIFGDRAETLPVQQIEAGGDFHFQLPDQPATVKSLAGSALVWQGQARDFAGFSKEGIYEIRQGDHVEWVAVSGNPDEAKPDFLPIDQVPLLRNLPHDAFALSTEDDLTRPEVSSNSATSFYRWLLLAALLVLLIETWLAHERSSDLGRKLFQSLLATASKSSGRKAAETSRI